jgi:folate-dependent phosphoribosylglycinamide formyltransferase PurN
MNNKRYCVYCSGNASRALGFYTFSKNVEKYRPAKLIYDGYNKQSIRVFEDLLGNDFIHIDASTIPLADQNKIHKYTSEYIHDIMDRHLIDYMLCFGEKIFKKKMIDAYRGRLINFHPSLLPSFKGRNAIDQALVAEVETIGNSSHFINEGIDTGTVILQSSMHIADFDNYEDVLELQYPMWKIILRDMFGYDIDDEEITAEIKHRTKPYSLSKLQI